MVLQCHGWDGVAIMGELYPQGKADEASPSAWAEPSPSQEQTALLPSALEYVLCGSLREQDFRGGLKEPQSLWANPCHHLSQGTKTHYNIIL